MNQSLYSKSIKLILENQSIWGSYVASPKFPTYQYCWLRDGSFIAHAMDTAGEFASATAFFRWVGRTIQKYEHKVEDIKQHLEAGLPIGKDDVFHTRYTLDGEEVTADSTWGNFQIDGYGTWLWALGEHVKISGDISLLNELYGPIQTTLRYLELVWKLPNYDCWEEHPQYMHPYSLATVYAGFKSISSLIISGKLIKGSIDVEDLSSQTKSYIMKFGVIDEKLIKFFLPAQLDYTPQPAEQHSVDSSLIGISTPFQVLSVDDPIMMKTIQAIEKDLHRPKGGIYRYKADVFYGGGEWLLLTAWLGWYYSSAGKMEQAKDLLHWIESQADSDGNLAEQVSGHTLAPKHFDTWTLKWGPIAKPLVWSHAMYIILINAINEGKVK
jgi:GH15 family glucan-1,4-alpha-glucosidase